MRIWNDVFCCCFDSLEAFWSLFTMAIVSIVDHSSDVICIFKWNWLWRFSLCAMIGHAFENLCYFTSLTSVSTIANDWILVRYSCLANCQYQFLIFFILHRPCHSNLLDLMEVDACQNKNSVSPHCLLYHQGMLQYQPIPVCYFESTPLNPIASICELENWRFCAMEKTLIWYCSQLSHGLCMNPWFSREECRNWWWQFYSKRKLWIWMALLVLMFGCLVIIFLFFREDARRILKKWEYKVVWNMILKLHTVPYICIKNKHYWNLKIPVKGLKNFIKILLYSIKRWKWFGTNKYVSNRK